MIGALQNGLSGMQAFADQTAVTANNVANSNTQDYTASRAVMSEETDGGVRVSIQKAASQTPASGNTQAEGGNDLNNRASNVDMSEEMVNLAQSQQGYNANMQLVRSVDQTTGGLLNVLG